MDIVFNKNSFNIDNVNSELKNFCLTNNIANENLLKMQLVCEEFLSNILFPNFENDVSLTVYRHDEDTILSFAYLGNDYMNKINELTMISLKILENETKEITSNTKDNKTIVNFII